MYVYAMYPYTCIKTHVVLLASQPLPPQKSAHSENSSAKTPSEGGKRGSNLPHVNRPREDEDATVRKASSAFCHNQKREAQGCNDLHP